MSQEYEVRKIDAFYFFYFLFYSSQKTLFEAATSGKLSASQNMLIDLVNINFKDEVSSLLRSLWNIILSMTLSLSMEIHFLLLLQRMVTVKL
jgi:hypothetical protein